MSKKKSGFAVSHRAGAKFVRRGLRTYFEYRDLGWKDSTKGDYVAHIVKANGKELYERHVIANHGHIDCIFGRDASRDEAPVVLDDYANTSSAGSIIAFHKHRDGFDVGDVGVISGFGAGYSAGTVVVRKSA